MRPGNEALLIKIGKRQKLLKPGDWFYNPNTPVGDDAEYFERKPYGGKREFVHRDIIARGPDAIARMEVKP